MLPFIVAMWIFGILSLRKNRWAFAAFVLMGLLYFPARVDFQLKPRACQLALDIPLATFSLTNYAHILLFAVFFAVTSAQFRMDRFASYIKAGLLTIGMGAMVELAEAVTGAGNCRLRDLIPDIAGAILGMTAVFAFSRLVTAVRGVNLARRV